MVEVDEIDKTFYECLDDVKQGYIDMYPKFQFEGSLKIGKIINNTKISAEKKLVLFSGGVDAFQTLLSHLEEKPCLATVWGADVKLDDILGWEKIIAHTKMTSEQYGLKWTSVKTNFREMLNIPEIEIYAKYYIGDGWWHGLQHGLALITSVAPYNYVEGIKTTYIASSFMIKEKGIITCASDPSIDNYVKYACTDTIHDGYDFNRQQKIKRICEFADQYDIKIPLHVCWESKGGDNCCKCEKCYRTMFGIIAEKRNSNNYGFNCSEQSITDISEDILNNIEILESRWNPIIETFKRNYSIDDTPDNLKWIQKMTIKQMNSCFKKKKRNYI